MVNHPIISMGFGEFWRATGAVALALCLSAGAYAQQDQGQQPDQQQAQPPQPTPDQTRPTYAPQDADKPPYSHDSHDRPRQNPPPEGQSQNAPLAQPAQPVPGTLTIPAGTILLIRINDYLSSDRNQIGDQFTAVLENPLVVNGWVVARRGQMIVGHVKDVRKAGRIKGTSELGVELTDLTVVDGHQVPILTELWKGAGGTSHGQDAATVATTTGLGALIGAAADWGEGAAIGAGAGAAAGIGAVLLTRGRPTVLHPEEQLSFRLVDPVRIDTTQSQQAFLPVTQQDIDGGRLERRGPRHVAGGYPGPGPYPCGYYGPCYAYPGYAGFYGGWGWGPGFYGRRGFRR
ncbi:MAG: hypothetical protein JWN63_171 [Candidatus Acidoferrum typicum]|nr:hypothetical protein [Candidatus Acidoferrum typicum]